MVDSGSGGCIMYAIKPSVRVYLGEIEEGVAGRITGCISRLCRDYPKVADRMYSISTVYGHSSITPQGDPEGWHDGVLAVCNIAIADVGSCFRDMPAFKDVLGKYAIKPTLYEFNLSFNPHHFGNEERLLDTERRMRDTKTNPPGTCRMEGTIAHEFGHAVYKYIEGDIPGITDKIYSLVEEGAKNDEEICSALSASGIIHTSLDAMLSGRDPKDIICSEAFANGFAAMRYGTPTVRSRPLVKYIQSAVGEQFGR